MNVRYLAGWGFLVLAFLSAAFEALDCLVGGKPFSNGFHHGTVGVELVAASGPPK